MKIIFIGTSEFGKIILERLISSTSKPFLAISSPDKPVGRKQIITPPPVKVLAEKHKIPVVQPEKIIDYAAEIKKLMPDLIISAAYGQMIPEEILTIPERGCINVHPSLLPLWRGPSPIQYAILNGDKKAGVTVMKMTNKMDAGPVISQKETEVSDRETFQELHDKLASLGSELLIETLPKMFSGKVCLQPQDDTKATYSKILKKEDGEIDWQKPAEVLARQIRAFSSWPGSYTFFKYKNRPTKIEILKAKILKAIDGKTHPVGKTLLSSRNELSVQTSKDFLVIERLQMEGKNEMSSEDFLRGRRDFIGTILCSRTTN